jgi:metal-sulfur cluster biosynthetic enzyme/ribosomal protein L22
MTTLGVLAVREEQARVVATDARAALASVQGLPAVRAVAKLRFGPGRTCEPVARVLDRAVARAERAGLTAAQVIVVDGSAEPGEDIVRVRRKAHGKADWISSPTSTVYVELRPEGLVHVERQAMPPVAGPVPRAPVEPGPPDARADSVRDVLYDVLDPDLGVNIVDLGFVRDIRVDGDGRATITMTLTSAACPLTQIMEDQISTALRDGPTTGFGVDWTWLPAWRPADISADGRDQLRAIGFSNF